MLASLRGACSTRFSSTPIASSALASVRTISSRNKNKVKLQGGRGTRNTGWYQAYRAGLGGRHLQNSMSDVDQKQVKLWNDRVFSLPSSATTKVPRRVYLNLANLDTSPDKLNDKSSRVVIELANGAMPLTTANFFHRFISPSSNNDNSASSTTTTNNTVPVSLVEKNVGLIFSSHGSSSPAVSPASPLLSSSGPLPVSSPSSVAFSNGENSGLLSHKLPFMVSMAPTSNAGLSATTFVITTVPARHLDGLAIPFGRVVEGGDVLKKLLLGFTIRGKPAVPIGIVKAGVVAA